GFAARSLAPPPAIQRSCGLSRSPYSSLGKGRSSAARPDKPDAPASQWPTSAPEGSGGASAGRRDSGALTRWRVGAVRLERPPTPWGCSPRSVLLSLALGPKEEGGRDGWVKTVHPIWHPDDLGAYTGFLSHSETGGEFTPAAGQPNSGQRCCCRRR